MQPVPVIAGIHDSTGPLLPGCWCPLESLVHSSDYKVSRLSPVMHGLLLNVLGRRLSHGGRSERFVCVDLETSGYEFPLNPKP